MCIFCQWVWALEFSVWVMIGVAGKVDSRTKKVMIMMIERFSGLDCEDNMIEKIM